VLPPVLLRGKITPSAKIISKNRSIVSKRCPKIEKEGKDPTKKE